MFLRAPTAPSPAVLATAGLASALVTKVDFTWSTAIVASLWRHVGSGRSVRAEHLQEPAGLEPRRAGRHHRVDLIRQTAEVLAPIDIVLGVLPDAEVEAGADERDVLPDVRR